MAIDNYGFLPLKVETDIKPFKSKDSDINGFLLDDAKRYLTGLMAVTYLLEDRATGVTVAYFSLLNDKITFDPEQRSIWNRPSRRIANPKRRKHYPAVKVGRNDPSISIIRTTKPRKKTLSGLVSYKLGIFIL